MRGKLISLVSLLMCFFLFFAPSDSHGHPSKKRIILDTDAFNEIDDQFAITYLVKSEQFTIVGFTSTHYGKKGSSQKSYREILHILKLLGMESQYPVLKGADMAMRDTKTPIHSPAVHFIIDEASKTMDDPLYIISTGPITNLSSAYLIEPLISTHIKAIWIAGRAWPKGGMLCNNKRDIIAAQVAFNSDMDLTLIPSYGTAEQIKLYKKDRLSVYGHGEIGDYLWKLFMHRLWKPKSLYDLAAIAAVISPQWCTFKRVPRPAIMDNGKYDHRNTEGTLKVMTDLDEHRIRDDFFRVLQR